MKGERLFVIKTIDESKNINEYVKNFTSNFTGYFFTRTKNIKKAHQWKYKKSCENAITLLTTKLNPTKLGLKNYKFEIVEITDIRILRKIKLKQINKLHYKNKL
ncbi:hypothetical protein M0Q97_02725 [Candidatus Dojkabacteria bacterium]|jgi:hypothetical protein|nr:hypothetical protein [Candidatus Dojkabacteria bacterium]